jgi:AcrR family transcriptional regulator
MPRQNIKESRRLQLIEANMACIARLGLTDTTIAHVSKEAGMSRGICNFYFESKEKMMQETLRQLTADYAEWLERAGDSLEEIISGHFSSKLCSARRLAVWMAFVAHAAAHAPYRKLLATSHDQTVAALERGGAGEQAGDLAALIKGLWQQFLLVPEAASREALAERCLAFAQKQPALKIVAQSAKPAKPARKAAEEMPMFDLFAKKA